MTNTQMIILIVTVIGSQLGNLYYLGGRIDQLASRMDKMIETVHEIDKRVLKLEERKAG